MALHPILRSLVALSLASPMMVASAAHHGRQFFGLTDFSEFTREPGESPGETVFLSPELETQIKWDELIVSWNAEAARDVVLKIQAHAIYPGRSTRFYMMGIWSCSPEDHQRMSVKNQKDQDAEVRTDTLRLNRPADRLRIRLVLNGSGNISNLPIKLIGLCLADTTHELSVLPPNRAAWGRSCAVPERTQLDFPEGERSWCSPVSTSMVLGWWAGQLGRPDLDRPVPEVAKQVEDPNWPGTGNWPFNTAYAGSFPGMRAYVSRFSDVTELEDWIANGIPVAASVAYTALKGVPPRDGPDGHLVVCVGFTEDGNVIVNDPGSRTQTRRIVPRGNFVKAWAHSHNTVYLIYPNTAALPADRFGHWSVQPAQSPTRLSNPHPNN